MIDFAVRASRPKYFHGSVPNLCNSMELSDTIKAALLENPIHIADFGILPEEK